jgi:hypothetical protein
MTSILLHKALDKMEPVWVRPGQAGADARAAALDYIQHPNGRRTPGVIQEIMRVVGIAEHAAASLIRLFDSVLRDAISRLAGLARENAAARDRLIAVQKLLGRED